MHPSPELPLVAVLLAAAVAEAATAAAGCHQALLACSAVCSIPLACLAVGSIDGSKYPMQVSCRLAAANAHTFHLTEVLCQSPA